MLAKTGGVVIHSLPYSDSSIIVRIFTEKSGLQSYLVKGAHGKRSKLRAAIFQPLTILELVVYRQEKKTLHAIREAKIALPYMRIPFDIYRTAIVLFLSEILYKCIREEEPHPEIYTLLVDELQELDAVAQPDPLFHLHFMIRLSHLLGFGPLNNYDEENNVFSLRDGRFIDARHLPRDDHFHFTPAASEQLHFMLAGHRPRLAHDERNALLRAMIRYFQAHVPGLNNINSNQVLEDVFSG